MDYAEVVRRAQSGDQQAMGELYEKTSQRVYALALRLTSDPELAMDVVQDTYLAAMKKLDQLREPEAVLHWLFQIAANRCHKLQKKEGRYVQPQQDEDEEEFFESIPDPDEKILPETVVDGGETRRILRELMDDLPQTQRECMVLFYFSQLPVEQIAAIQECSEGTVKSRLNYGRKKLKESVLALESRDGIRLHSLAPVGLLFRLIAEELPDPHALLNVWHSVSAQLGTAAAAGGGTAAAAAAGNSPAAAGGAAAAKSSVAGALKLKIAAGVAACAVAVGGAGLMLHQPSVTFSDPAFEQNIRVLLDKPEGAIRPEDLASIRFLGVLEDGMIDQWTPNISLPEEVGAAGTTGVTSLEDLSLLTGLEELNYLIHDGGALLDTAGENENLIRFSNFDLNNTDDYTDTYLRDLRFIQKFPNLKSLTAWIVSDADLTPVEEQTSLTDLSVFTNGDGVLDVSKLTKLSSLRFWSLQGGTLQMESSVQLPALRILDVYTQVSGPPVLGFLKQTPGLEYIRLQSFPDLDLTPLSWPEGLRAVILGTGGPFDLTPLEACPSLEACCISTDRDAVIPEGLPVVVQDDSAAFAILAEIQQETRQ